MNFLNVDFTQALVNQSNFVYTEEQFTALSLNTKTWEQRDRLKQTKTKDFGFNSQLSSSDSAYTLCIYGFI